jgi:hypothetical protein
MKETREPLVLPCVGGTALVRASPSIPGVAEKPQSRSGSLLDMFNHLGRAPAPCWQLNFLRTGDFVALLRKLIGRR